VANPEVNGGIEGDGGGNGPFEESASC
jgi:hypothetical protein